jgi:hypothetical protein
MSHKNGKGDIPSRPDRRQSIPKMEMPSCILVPSLPRLASQSQSPSSALPRSHRASLRSTTSLREALPKSTTTCRPPTYANQEPRFPPKTRKWKPQPGVSSPFAPSLPFAAFASKRKPPRTTGTRTGFPLSALGCGLSTSAALPHFPTGSATKIHNLLRASNLRQSPSPLPSKNQKREARWPSYTFASFAPLRAFASKTEPLHDRRSPNPLPEPALRSRLWTLDFGPSRSR